MSCPICAGETDDRFRPFCSKRCADVDLAKWLGEGYAIPSDDPDDAEIGSGPEDNGTEPAKPH